LFQRATKTKRLKKVFGRNAYIIRGLLDVIGYKPGDIKIKINGEDVYNGKIWAGQIANTPTTGGGKVYIEGADPRDGELTFVYIPMENARRRQLPGLVSDLTDFANLPEAEVVRGVKTFELEGEVDLGYCGENIGRVNHVYGKILEGALTVLMPSDCAPA
jgi:diacylglycerol kinase family enzyme